MNRLSGEKSPYLLQHASNPVDWFPWGDEAFEKARREDRLIFLSIGYSTCHWCHVMAHESFEDIRVAEEMNRHLVCVKVDREERPDIDQAYMEFCQRLTGRGGWPLNLFLTPEGSPFFAATYVPARGRGGRMGMLELVPHLAGLWKDQREIVRQAVRSASAPSGPLSSGSPVPADLEGAPKKASLHFQRHFDGEFGGFYGAPKFPLAHTLGFLLRYAAHRGETGLVPLVEMTLERMRAGGIRDHLGGGFHRYSVDRGWRLPHFEKMLYDQAMMAEIYLEGGLATGKSCFLSTARETLDYVLRDLQAPGGAFFSAEDADSGGAEGAFYTWTWRELEELLSAEELDSAVLAWGLRREGNFPPEAGDRDGRNLLYGAGGDVGQARPGTEALRKKLWQAREKRPRPGRDEKVLADWNGLMIGTLARCGACLDEPRFIHAAERAALFFIEAPSPPGGGIWHRWAGGEWAVPGFLDDHAFLIRGLLELYQATFDPLWVRHALRLAEDSLQRFAHGESGALTFSEGTDPRLPARCPVAEDGPYPSGNGIMAYDLHFLGLLAGRQDLVRHGAGILEAFAGQVGDAPWGFASLLDALMLQREGAVRIWLGGVGDRGDHPFLPLLRSRMSPRWVLAGVRRGMEEQAQGLLEAPEAFGHAGPWAQVFHRGGRCVPAFDERLLSEQLQSLEGSAGENA